MEQWNTLILLTILWNRSGTKGEQRGTEMEHVVFIEFSKWNSGEGGGGGVRLPWVGKGALSVEHF